MKLHVQHDGIEIEGMLKNINHGKINTMRNFCSFMCKHYVYIHLSLCRDIFCAPSMWLLCALEDIRQASSSLWKQPFHEYVQIIKRYHRRHPLHRRSSEQLHIILTSMYSSGMERVNPCRMHGWKPVSTEILDITHLALCTTTLSI